MMTRFSVCLAAMWVVGCAAQAGGGETDLAEGSYLGGDTVGSTDPAAGTAAADMAPWGAAGGAAEAPIEDEAPAPEASDAPTSSAAGTSSEASGTESTPDASGSSPEPSGTSTPSSSSGTQTTPAASQPPPLFQPPDPDRTPSPENITECPDEAPADPWGPCVGVPVYAVCNYGTTYSCICDWIHWICVG